MYSVYIYVHIPENFKTSVFRIYSQHTKPNIPENLKTSTNQRWTETYLSPGVLRKSQGRNTHHCCWQGDWQHKSGEVGSRETPVGPIRSQSGAALAVVSKSVRVLTFAAVIWHCLLSFICRFTRYQFWVWGYVLVYTKVSDSPRKLLQNWIFGVPWNFLDCHLQHKV